jgi:hypothetical protein
VAFAPIALRDTPVDGVADEQFHGAATVQDSTPKILGYLDRVRPALSKAEAAFKPFFKGESPVSRLDSLRTTLAEADKAQESARRQAPESTTRLNEQKGELLQIIEDLNRIAKVAYRGRTDMSSRFNKDILRRARRTKTGKAGPAPAPVPNPTPSPTPG